MKNAFLFLSLLLVVNFHAQQVNITDAYNALKKYVPMVGDPEANKKTLATAKAAIDLAAVNAETSTNMDMHKHRAKIYFGLMEIATIEAAQSGKEPDSTQLNIYEKVVKQSINYIFNAPKNKKQKDDITTFFKEKTSFFFEIGVGQYNAKNYKAATLAFMAAYLINQYIDEDYKEARENTRLALIHATDTLIFQKKLDEALTLGEEVYMNMPKDIEILISLININLQKNDIVTTEKYLNEANSMDTTNKSLYVVLGTSLMELKQNERAEKAFLRALKIDPLHPESVYQYSSFLFNWSFDLRNEASDLKYKDPRIPVLEKEAKEIMERILIYLVPFLDKFPNDKTALEIGWKTYSMLDNEAKKTELKTRWEAIK